jgi:maleate cis-trans isomerase
MQRNRVISNSAAALSNALRAFGAGTLALLTPYRQFVHAGRNVAWRGRTIC